MAIHPTAFVSRDARIGDGVVVGPFACIEEKVQVGDGCVIGPHAVLLPNTTLGPRCRVHAGAVLGDLPQDLSYKGTESFVSIGAECIFREGATVHRGAREGSVTRVGDRCLLMANSHVAHDAQLGNRVVLCNGALLAGFVEVGDGAFISGNCLVHQFTRVGRLVMMSGGSAVQMDVPPFCMTRSMCSNTVVGLNVIGLKRAGLASEERRALKAAFDCLYRHGLPVARALALLEEDASPAIEELRQFVASARRGICKFIGDADDAGMRVKAAA